MKAIIPAAAALRIWMMNMMALIIIDLMVFIITVIMINDRDIFSMARRTTDNQRMIDVKAGNTDSCRNC